MRKSILFNSEKTEKPKTLTGTRLRSYAFALLTRRDYSQAELIAKLNQYAINSEEVEKLVEELAQNNYQSDQRVAELTLASQLRKGKGLQRIKQALKAKQLDAELITEELQEVDWLDQAYQLKLKKFGEEVATDPKIKARQIRFLQYRGFDMGVIMKAIARTSEEE
jgi:regulatory protein